MKAPANAIMQHKQRQLGQNQFWHVLQKMIAEQSSVIEMHDQCVIKKFERRIIVLSFPDISFVILRFVFQRFEIKSGFPFFIIHTVYCWRCRSVFSPQLGWIFFQTQGLNPCLGFFSKLDSRADDEKVRVDVTPPPRAPWRPILDVGHFVYFWGQGDVLAHVGVRYQFRSGGLRCMERHRGPLPELFSPLLARKSSGFARMILVSLPEITP